MDQEFVLDKDDIREAVLAYIEKRLGLTGDRRLLPRTDSSLHITGKVDATPQCVHTQRIGPPRVGEVVIGSVDGELERITVQGNLVAVKGGRL